MESSEVIESVQGEDEVLEQDQEDVQPEGGEEQEEESELIVTIGNEEPAEDQFRGKPAPQWVKDMREENKRLKRELKEKTQPSVEEQLGPEKTLEDFDHDAEKYRAYLKERTLKEQQIENKKKQEEEREKTQQQEWDKKVEKHLQKGQELRAKDFGDAEDFIESTFSVMQRGMIIDGAENSALVHIALYRNPKVAQELQTITNPVKFAFAVARLENQLNVTDRKVKVQPEKKIQGNALDTSTGDKKLEELRRKAEKTGDYTAVNQYKRQLRQRSK